MVLYGIIWSYVTLYSTQLCDTKLFHVISHFIILHCIVSFRTMLHYVLVHCNLLNVWKGQWPSQVNATTSNPCQTLNKSEQRGFCKELPHNARRLPSAWGCLPAGLHPAMQRCAQAQLMKALKHPCTPRWQLSRVLRALVADFYVHAVGGLGQLTLALQGS